MIGVVMPALLSALGFGKIQHSFSRAPTRRICAAFFKHGLSVNAFRVIKLVFGVAECALNYKLCLTYIF